MIHLLHNPAATAIEQARATKTANAVTAVLAGILPAALLAVVFPSSPLAAALGFLLGLGWANAFEYFYHRFWLHHTLGRLARGHQKHHAVTGTPHEAEKINFGESPLWVLLLFALNGIPVAAAEWWVRLGIAPGVLAAFVLYFLAVEEIHWRIHLGGWLPGGLRKAREYHLAHHRRADGKFNVFLPLFDWLLCTTGGSCLQAHPALK